MLVIDQYMKSGELVEAPVFMEGMIQEATAIHEAFPEYLVRDLKKKILETDDNPFDSEYFTNIDLLKIGRHFRLDKNAKLVVGRNKDENEMIKALALQNDILLEAKEHVGPTTLLRGNNIDNHVELSASVTLRYSDAPKNKTGVVLVHKNEDATEISVKSAEETAYIKLRI